MTKKFTLGFFLLLFSACTYNPNIHSNCRSNNCDRYRQKRFVNQRYIIQTPQKKQVKKRTEQQIARQVRFSKLKFKKVSGGDGLWTGFLEGDGLARLKLNFIKNGKVQVSRYIGSVMLEAQDPPTIFRFKSHLPADRQMQWEVQSF